MNKENKKTGDKMKNNKSNASKIEDLINPETLKKLIAMKELKKTN